MKMILVVATSMDGFITKGSDPDPSSWTSIEDKKFYESIRKQHKLHVMGKNTYGGKTPPFTSELKVVMTKNPKSMQKKYKFDGLKFTNLSPADFIKKYQDTYNSCLVLGGSYVYTSFLEAGVIDEIYQTVEPLTHAGGIPFIREGKKLSEIVNLPEPDITKLNKSGTILKHYVLK